jgi:hypothetical protein
MVLEKMVWRILKVNEKIENKINQIKTTKMKSLLICILISIFSQVCYSANFVDLSINIDSSSYGRSNQFDFQLGLIKENGKIIYLSVYEPGFRWNNVKVSGQYITHFKDGRVTFNQTEITALNNKMVMTVSYSSNDNTIERKFVVSLPFVKAIKVLNDTLRYNESVLLNHKLIFNNNKEVNANENLFNSNNISMPLDQKVQINNGFITLNTNQPIKNNEITIVLKNKLTNQLLAEKLVYIKYSSFCKIQSKGKDGRAGQNGSSTNNTSANGGNGLDGSFGEIAPDLKSYIQIETFENQEYVSIETFLSNGLSQKNLVLLNDETKIYIESFGGTGGNGGNGGKAGSGSVDSNYGGNGGNGGSAGNGGDAGLIILYVAEDSKKVIDKIITNNIGGKSGVKGIGGGKGYGYSTGFLNSLFNIYNGNNGADGSNGNEGIGGKETKVYYLTDSDFELEKNKIQF